MGKNKQNTPRRKRMKRNQRLHDAKTKWLPTTTVKNHAKSYSKWYGVDLLCAINELEMLGYTFSENYKKQVKLAIEHKADRKRRRKESLDEYSLDQDETFSFIAGYTENGVPFGIRYDDE